MNYLAFDFGAEKGRAVLGSLENGKITLKEIHRFPNEPIFQNGHLRWNIENLFAEIKIALKMVAQNHIQLSGIGIDTWGVDFGLVDSNGKLLENPVSYRDSRTDGIMEKVFEKISKEEIYKKTGIQFLPFNTIYQLYCVADDASLKESKKLLFIPDIFNYLLTGKQNTETTIASTSQLLNITTQSWDKEIFTKLELNLNTMPAPLLAGDVVGMLDAKKVGVNELQNVPVFAVGSHDTASAVAAVPISDETSAYISSGTWSLIGAELDSPIINEDSLKFNFTNEAGVFGKFRFLKNCAGFWLMQECRKHWSTDGELMTYEKINALAEKAPAFQSLIQVNHNSFLHPENMLLAITNFCTATGQPVPKTTGEFARCILQSLALEYKKIIAQLESLTGKAISTIHIVGGGSQNEQLNQMVANATKKTVLAGPSEATALGNILVQAIGNKELANLNEARKVVLESFPVKQYLPKDQALWQDAFLRYNQLNV